MTVMFVVFCMLAETALYYVYFLAHLPTSQPREKEQFSLQCAFFGVSLGLTVLFFVLAAYTDPGTIPEDDDAWESEEYAAEHCSEKKNTGLPRYCKWCQKFKPDRCHHCRLCDRCVLKMDHHCPWIGNCVGHHNHRSFFLLLIWANVSLYLVIANLSSDPSVAEGVLSEGRRLGVTACLTLAYILAVPLTGFLLFHMWLLPGSGGMLTVFGELGVCFGGS
jgi:hypothetical protein